MNQVKVDAILGELIRACRESRACFDAWAGKTNDLELRHLLSYRARRCNRDEMEISLMRDEFGELNCIGPELNATLKTRRWSELRRRISLAGNRNVLQACEAEDSRALVLYRDVLEYDLPVPVAKVVGQQFSDLIDQHARLQRMQSQPKATSSSRTLDLSPQV